MREGVKTMSVGTTRQSIRISVTSIAHRDYFTSKCSSTWLIWFTVHCTKFSYALPLKEAEGMIEVARRKSSMYVGSVTL